MLRHNLWYLISIKPKSMVLIQCWGLDLNQCSDKDYGCYSWLLWYSRDSIISTFSIISTVCKIPKWLYYKHSTKVNFRSRKNISTVSIISTVQKISKWLYHKYSTKAIFRLNEKITSVFYKCGESFEVETLRYFLYC